MPRTLAKPCPSIPDKPNRHGNTRRRTLRELYAIVGTLTRNSKMPGYAFSLPALDACPVGAKLALLEDTPCANCYGLKGNHLFPNVLESHRDKLRKVKESLRDETARARWVDAMVELLSRRVDPADPYFRIHAVGDFFDLAYLQSWCDVATRLPWVQFWAPTREMAAVRLAAVIAPENLLLRFSAPKIDEYPDLPGVDAVAYITRHVPATGPVCPAPDQGGKCADCRACWQRSHRSTTYRFH